MIEHRYPLDQSTAEAAYSLWDYLRVKDPLEQADVINVLGCSTNQVGVTAANLYHRGYSDLVVCTGANSKKTNGWPVTEARINKATMVDLKVPGKVILTEPRACNFGQNIEFTRNLLADIDVFPRSVIGVAIDFGSRRWRASMEVQWPGVRAIVVPAGIEFNTYLTDQETFNSFIRGLRFEFSKILDYPDKGFMSRQDLNDPQFRQALDGDSLLEDSRRMALVGV